MRSHDVTTRHKLPLIAKIVHLQRTTAYFQCTENGTRLACLSYVIQQFKSNAQLQQLPLVRCSRSSTRNTIDRAGSDAGDDGLSVFLSARRRLFAIAYRMLRNAAEAEDIVQDVWIRWQTTDRSAVRDAAAFLATTTRRLAINVIQAARSRRETFAQPSLQEPVGTSGDPELKTERREALQRAGLVLLQKLSPSERAAYVLRKAFGYSYREIATVLRLQEANARQLVARGQRHVDDNRCAAVNSVERHHFLSTFIAAAEEGALAALESFFSRMVEGSVGRIGRQHRPNRTCSASLRYAPLANQCLLLQRDVNVESPFSDGPLALEHGPMQSLFAGHEAVEYMALEEGADRYGHL